MTSIENFHTLIERGASRRTRTYFVTVRTFEAAIGIDPLAKFIRTLPATKYLRLFCCHEAEAHHVGPAYIYQVRVAKRRDAEKASGVIRCRAKEPERYRTLLTFQVC